MSIQAVALLLVLVPLAFAAVPCVYARRSGALFAADIGLVLIPAPILLAALAAFNKPAHIGWAGAVYPYFALWLSVLALYVRVFVLPRVGLPARSAAVCILLVASIAAAFFGTFAPPYYE